MVTTDIGKARLGILKYHHLSILDVKFDERFLPVASSYSLSIAFVCS